MKKLINILSIYQVIFGLLGLIFILLSITGQSLYDHLLGIVLFLLSISSGVLLFIGKTQKIGILISIFNNLLQSAILIVGNVWYQYQSGIAIGFGYHQFMRNEWVGTRKNLILNIGANYRLMFNDHNTELYIGINIWAILIVFILIIIYKKRSTVKPIITENIIDEDTKML